MHAGRRKRRAYERGAGDCVSKFPGPSARTPSCTHTEEVLRSSRPGVAPQVGPMRRGRCNRIGCAGLRGARQHTRLTGGSHSGLRTACRHSPPDPCPSRTLPHPPARRGGACGAREARSQAVSNSGTGAMNYRTRREDWGPSRAAGRAQAPPTGRQRAITPHIQSASAQRRPEPQNPPGAPRLGRSAQWRAAAAARPCPASRGRTTKMTEGMPRSFFGPRMSTGGSVAIFCLDCSPKRPKCAARRRGAALSSSTLRVFEMPMPAEGSGAELAAHSGR